MSKSTIAYSFRWKHVWLSIFMMLVSICTFAQQQIRGTVRNAANAPVENVSVSVKGTTRGTTTDAQGRFSIQARENETLVVSFVGFQTQEVEVGKRTNTDWYDIVNPITLEEQPFYRSGSNTLNMSYTSADIGYFYKLGGEYNVTLGRWMKARSQTNVLLTKQSQLSEIEGEGATKLLE